MFTGGRFAKKFFCETHDRSPGCTVLSGVGALVAREFHPHVLSTPLRFPSLDGASRRTPSPGGLSRHSSGQAGGPTAVTAPPPIPARRVVVLFVCTLGARCAAGGLPTGGSPRRHTHRRTRTHTQLSKRVCLGWPQTYNSSDRRCASPRSLACSTQQSLRRQQPSASGME